MVFESLVWPAWGQYYQYSEALRKQKIIKCIKSVETLITFHLNLIDYDTKYIRVVVSWSTVSSSLLSSDGLCIE